METDILGKGGTIDHEKSRLKTCGGKNPVVTLWYPDIKSDKKAVKVKRRLE